MTHSTARFALSGLFAVVLALAACSDYRDTHTQPPQTGPSPDAFPNDSHGTIQRFAADDPTMQKFFDSAYGYAVFPKIAKGAAGIGAANGRGDVFEQGRHIGTTEMTQITLGAQLGGQTFSEIIFFQDKSYLDFFKDGNLEFAANASAIAAESGAGATNDFHQGIAVFVKPRGGLMFEAAIGGQKFSYRPLAP